MDEITVNKKITVNKNGVPGGVQLGLTALTSRGLGTHNFNQVAVFLSSGVCTGSEGAGCGVGRGAGGV